MIHIFIPCFLILCFCLVLCVSVYWTHLRLVLMIYAPHLVAVALKLFTASASLPDYWLHEWVRNPGFFSMPLFGLQVSDLIHVPVVFFPPVLTSSRLTSASFLITGSWLMPQTQTSEICLPHWMSFPISNSLWMIIAWLLAPLLDCGLWKVCCVLHVHRQKNPQTTYSSWKKQQQKNPSKMPAYSTHPNIFKSLCHLELPNFQPFSKNSPSFSEYETCFPCPFSLLFSVNSKDSPLKCESFSASDWKWSEPTAQSSGQWYDR